MSAAILKKMRDMGLTIDQAIELLEAVEKEASLKPARSTGAERQARYRARHAETVTRDVTRDVTGTPSLPPPPQTPPPPTHPRVEEPPIVPQGDEKTIPVIRLRQADVEDIWEITPPSARTRTSRADIKASLQAAARRGKPPAIVRAGLKAYYASEAATKDNGQFAKGAHRMIEKDRFLDFIGQPDIATVTVDPWPGRLREFVRNGHWNTVDWGPRPGKPECRAPPDLVAEHAPTTRQGQAA